MVLYFYPKDDTTGCTAEACGFRDILPNFGKADATVIGISRDSVASHDKFKKKYELPFTLASDDERQGLRGLRRLGREEHVRPQIHGHRARDLPDRRQGRHPQRLAQGEGARPCRRGAEGAEGAVSADARRRAPCAVLRAAAPADKVALSRRSPPPWRERRAAGSGRRGAARPAGPAGAARAASRRATCRAAAPRGSQAGRIALLHALAHIELNAIDLAWDLIARFAWPGCRANSSTTGSASPPRRRSITRCSPRGSRALGAAYGDLPAHDGLWEAAQATAHDLLARLAVVPLVLEARGLDVTPAMIERLERSGDDDSAAVLRIDLSTTRSAMSRRACAGSAGLCARAASTPAATYHALVRRISAARSSRPSIDARARGRAASNLRFTRRSARVSRPG